MLPHRRVHRAVIRHGQLALTLLVIPALHAQQPTARDTVRLAEIQLVGAAPAALLGIPGAAAVVDRRTLTAWHAPSVNEALRRVPGLAARDEEGLGLRPNIGIRGLSPTRSAKVLMLEDGIPFTIAPYGDNASYYHPPVGRFERIEIVKGSGQILFGPQTIGGVINYVTPAIPARASGAITVSGGDHAFRDVAVRAGASRGRLGALVSLEHRSGDGSRAMVGSRVDDANAKATVALGSRHVVTVRGNLFRERSNVTYSGLTEAEWATDPRGNAFGNDSMLLDRWAVSVSDEADLGRGATLLTTVYRYGIGRDWWRQSSNSAQRPNDAADPGCGGMANLNTTCGNEGRLRDYDVWGVEPRLRAPLAALGAAHLVEAGLRVHGERQERTQINGSTPTARSVGDPANPGAGVKEENLRTTDAWSAFVQDRVYLGRWTVTPGLRLEHVRHTRTNLLADPDVAGETSLTQLIPGLGASWQAAEHVTLFAGVHRGFAPPRAEDVISNSTGAVVELDAELSWNTEVGVRARVVRGLDVEATAFRLDFENQVVPASVAGGTGATLTSAGRTLHQGLELGAHLDLAALLGTRHDVGVDAALTWVPTARYVGERYAYVGTSAPDVVGKVYSDQNAGGTRDQVGVTGNRLPYAPAATLTAGIGYRYRAALDVRLEAMVVGRQYGDPVNTAVIVPDGQQGILPAYTVWNAAVNYTVGATRSTVFVAVRNVFDALYVADRSRGLLPGVPRSVQAGITQAF
jgi:Fe(3+) dicitrate transport protein